MKIIKLPLALAAIALVSAPVVAQAVMSPAVAPLSGDESGIEDGESILLAGLAAAAVIGAIIIASDDDNTELPISG